MNMRVVTLALAGLLSATGSASLAAQAQVASPPAPAPATPAPAPASPARVAATPAIWMVKDADTTIYLFGTIHLLPPNVDWKTGPVQRAYDSSKEVVLEIPEPAAATMQQVMMAKGLDPSGKPLTQKLTPAERPRYEAGMAKLGLPLAQFEPMRPWLAATVVSVTSVVKQGWDPNSGVERKVTAAAKQDGKPISGVETFEQQLDYLAGMPEPLQIRFLMSAVDDLDKVSVQSKAMLDAWMAGQPERLGAVLNSDLDKVPELRARLLQQRNARWATWIEQRLKQPGTVFMAVGAGHLAGADSVQAYLARDGIKAVRIVR